MPIGLQPNRACDVHRTSTVLLTFKWPHSRMQRCMQHGQHGIGMSHRQWPKLGQDRRPLGLARRNRGKRQERAAQIGVRICRAHLPCSLSEGSCGLLHLLRKVNSYFSLMRCQGIETWQWQSAYRCLVLGPQPHRPQLRAAPGTSAWHWCVIMMHVQMSHRPLTAHMRLTNVVV